MNVSQDHYNEFLDTKIRYNIQVGLQDEFPDSDIEVKFKDET